MSTQDSFRDNDDCNVNKFFVVQTEKAMEIDSQ